MLFLLDPGYLLVIVVTLVISGAAQLYVSSAYKKWSQVRNSVNMTGCEVGEPSMWTRRAFAWPFGDTTPG